MAKKQYPQAEKEYEQALKIAPRDYAGLVMMAKCQLVQKKHAAAQRYADRAKQVMLDTLFVAASQEIEREAKRLAKKAAKLAGAAA